MDKKKPVHSHAPASLERKVRLPFCPAEEAGFEPANGGSKVRCLTTWRLLTALRMIAEIGIAHKPALNGRNEEEEGGVFNV